MYTSILDNLHCVGVSRVMLSDAFYIVYTVSVYIIQSAVYNGIQYMVQYYLYYILYSIHYTVHSINGT